MGWRERESGVRREGEGGRERDRDRETETDSQTDTDTDRQTQRQTGIETETDRQKDRDRDRECLSGNPAFIQSSKGINSRSKDVTRIQLHRPESPTATPSQQGT